MPQARTFIRTVPGRGSGMGRSTISKGPFGRETCAARMITMISSRRLRRPNRSSSEPEVLATVLQPLTLPAQTTPLAICLQVRFDEPEPLVDAAGNFGKEIGCVQVTQ